MFPVLTDYSEQGTRLGHILPILGRITIFSGSSGGDASAGKKFTSTDLYVLVFSFNIICSFPKQFQHEMIS